MFKTVNCANEFNSELVIVCFRACVVGRAFEFPSIVGSLVAIVIDHSYAFKSGVLYSIKPRKKQQCILAFSSRQLSVFLAKQRVIVHLLVFEFDLFDDVPSLGC